MIMCAPAYRAPPSASVGPVIDDEGRARGVTTANWIDPPYNRWAFRHVSQVARTQRIGGGEAAIDLPRAERDHDAEIMLDASGFPLAEGGICATLRDCARFGLMCLQDGVIGGRQVVPADWLGRLLTPDAELVEAYRASDSADPASPGAMYHDTWWVDDPERGVYAASGMNGQLILVHRPARVVIVKLSTYPGALDTELFDLDHEGLTALCDYLA